VDDRKWMRIALEEAESAMQEAEVPVGAVIVKDDAVISHAHNLCAFRKDPTAHAEMLVLKEAYQKLGSLQDCTLYVTLEPCAMCVGAMLHMRLPRLVYGAFDPACGCCGSRVDLGDHWFESSIETTGGILEEDASAILKGFFSSVRKK
jgi:tRNA(adenine34) deaminase